MARYIIGALFLLPLCYVLNGAESEQKTQEEAIHQKLFDANQCRVLLEREEEGWYDAHPNRKQATTPRDYFVVPSKRPISRDYDSCIVRKPVRLSTYSNALREQIGTLLHHFFPKDLVTAVLLPYYGVVEHLPDNVTITPPIHHIERTYITPQSLVLHAATMTLELGESYRCHDGGGYSDCGMTIDLAKGTIKRKCWEGGYAEYYRPLAQSKEDDLVYYRPRRHIRTMPQSYWSDIIDYSGNFAYRSFCCFSYIFKWMQAHPIDNLTTRDQELSQQNYIVKSLAYTVLFKHEDLRQLCGDTEKAALDFCKEAGRIKLFLSKDKKKDPDFDKPIVSLIHIEDIADVYDDYPLITPQGTVIAVDKATTTLSRWSRASISGAWTRQTLINLALHSSVRNSPIVGSFVSPQGRYVVLTHQDNSVSCITCNSQERVWLQPSAKNKIMLVQWEPNEGRCAIAQKNGILHIIDPYDASELIKHCHDPLTWATAAIFHSQGSRLIVGHENGSILEYSLPPYICRFADIPRRHSRRY